MAIISAPSSPSASPATGRIRKKSKRCLFYGWFLRVVEGVTIEAPSAPASIGNTPLPAALGGLPLEEQSERTSRRSLSIIIGSYHSPPSATSLRHPLHYLCIQYTTRGGLLKTFQLFPDPSKVRITLLNSRQRPVTSMSKSTYQCWEASEYGYLRIPSTGFGEFVFTDHQHFHVSGSCFNGQNWVGQRIGVSSVLPPVYESKIVTSSTTQASSPHPPLEVEGKAKAVDWRGGAGEETLERAPFPPKAFSKQTEAAVENPPGSMKQKRGLRKKKGVAPTVGTEDVAVAKPITSFFPRRRVDTAPADMGANTGGGPFLQGVRASDASHLISLLTATRSGPEGWLARFPFMLPCRYRVLFMAAKSEYTVSEWDGADEAVEDGEGGRSVVYNGNGLGHCENNWGSAFPSSWVWAQGCHPEAPNSVAAMDAPFNPSQFLFAGVNVKLGWYHGFFWTVAYRSKNIRWDFLSPQLDQIEHTLDWQSGVFFIEARSHVSSIYKLLKRRALYRRILEIKVVFDFSALEVLCAPTVSGFTKENGPLESHKAVTQVTASIEDCKTGIRRLLETQKFVGSCFEVGGLLRGRDSASKNRRLNLG